jgi:hypothetical protein
MDEPGNASKVDETINQGAETGNVTPPGPSESQEAAPIFVPPPPPMPPDRRGIPKWIFAVIAVIVVVVALVALVESNILSYNPGQTTYPTTVSTTNASTTAAPTSVVSTTVASTTTVPQVNTTPEAGSCNATSSEFNCSSFTMVANGKVSFNFAQTSGITFYSTYFACTAGQEGVTQPGASMFNSSMPGLEVNSSEPVSVTGLQCYGNNDTQLNDLGPGTVNGWLWVIYALGPGQSPPTYSYNAAQAPGPNSEWHTTALATFSVRLG